MKIYTPRVSNDCLSVLPLDTRQGLALTTSLNRQRLLPGWERVDFEFKAFRKSGKIRPDIRLIGGGLAFREELAGRVFPNPGEELELLPIRISGEEWLITNCLKTTDKYDRENSILYRTPDSNLVFLINHIIVQDPTVLQCDLFVVKDSNRSSLLTLPFFVERIRRLGLRGITFSEIGVFAPESGVN